MTPIEWEPEWLPPEDQRERLEAAVRADVDALDLSHPSNLIMHCCFPDGDAAPWVFVCGEDDSDALHCRYDRRPAYG